MAPADSSPSEGSSGGVVMKGTNAGTQEKKKWVLLLGFFCLVWCYGRYLLLPSFLELDLPFPDENEVRQ